MHVLHGEIVNFFIVLRCSISAVQPWLRWTSHHAAADIAPPLAENGCGPASDALAAAILVFDCLYGLGKKYRFDGTQRFR